MLKDASVIMLIYINNNLKKYFQKKRWQPYKKVIFTHVVIYDLFVGLIGNRGGKGETAAFLRQAACMGSTSSLS
jgi:hypothetical protein